jgi:hypothetical protein
MMQPALATQANAGSFHDAALLDWTHTSLTGAGRHLG